jgi:hypothetical protein
MRQLVTVLLLAALAAVLISRVTTRGVASPTDVDRKQVRGGRIKFGIGIGLLGTALVLYFADVEKLLVTATYILGAGFLAQGYLQEFNARRRRRFKR